MFEFVRSLNAPNMPATKLMPAAAGSYTVGTALAISAGKLTAATGTTAPGYVSAFEGTATAGQMIPVIPVNGQEWKTSFSAAPTSIVVGSKVTLSADGKQVTATTTSGVATVIDMLGATASGDSVLVQL